MKKFQIAASTAVITLIIALGAGTLAGSWATARTGRTIPMLMAAPVSAAPYRVSFEEGFAPVVKNAVPAIVNVSSSKVIRTPGGSIPSPFFSLPFFRQFFGNPSPRDFQIPPSQGREHSLGSGVIVNSDGYILTNNHVIDGAKDVKVLLGDKREFQARVVGFQNRHCGVEDRRQEPSGSPVWRFLEDAGRQFRAGHRQFVRAEPDGDAGHRERDRTRRAGY